MSAPIYPLSVLLEAEARQDALSRAIVEECARATKRTLRIYRFQLTLQRLASYRRIGEALDLAAANLWRGKARSIAALLLFERQWELERRVLRSRGLRISGYDAVEQMVRCIRLWRSAGVISERGWGRELASPVRRPRGPVMVFVS